MTRAYFAIGDIHGQIDMLEDALARIHDDPLAGEEVVFVGDLVDRGPDSKAVIATLIEGLAEGEPWKVLKGNHDDFLLRFLDAPDAKKVLTASRLSYLDPRIGGRKTLASYGVDVDERRDWNDIQLDARIAIPAAHKSFLRALPLTYATEQHLFVHAGIRPGVPLAKQDPTDLMWIREPFLTSTVDHGPLVVHGHTPVEAPTHYGNRINTDVGAGYGHELMPIVLLERDAWALTDTGRLRL